jgi:hypothetical protein
MLLAQLEARPGFRRAIVRRLDRFPELKRGLKRLLGRLRARAAGTASVRRELEAEGLSARATRVLADLDRARQAADRSTLAR